jgi:hypothetical protein
MVKPSAKTLTDGSSLTSISIGTPYYHSSAQPCISTQSHPFLALATAISTENTGGSSIIGRISPFQVYIIHLDTFLQYFPGPWVPAPGSYLYRSKNIAPERQFSASLFSIKTWSNRVIKTALGGVMVFPRTYPNLRRIAPILPGMVGAPSCSLSGEAGHARNLCCNVNNCQNVAVPSPWNLSRHLSTIFPRCLGPCTQFRHLQIHK